MTSNGKQYTSFRGINLKSGNTAASAIRFPSLTDPVSSSADDHVLYVEDDLLKYWDGSSATTLGSAGAISNYSLNDAYDDGVGITVDAGAVLLAGTHATNNVMAVTGSAAVTGNLIDLAQSGSGKDIDGTSSLWSVSAAGAGIFASLATNTITASATNPSNLTIDATGTGTITLGATSTGAITLTRAVTATASITITGTADANCLTVTAGDILVSNGKIALTNDDTDSAVTITAASVTTGNVISATAVGITTGSILYLSTSEAGITSGNGSYIECYDSTAGATQFLVSDDGATTITGDAVGTTALGITAGDITVSDGNLALTSSSTTDVVSITDDSLLANNALIVKGSGVFTGTAASSFVAITPTGMTTGTALYVAGAAASTLSTLADFTTSTTTGTALRLTTTGVQTGVGSALEIVADSATTPGAAAGEGVVKISADGLTTGTALDVTSTAGNALTTGRIADFSHISGNITGTLNKTADFFNVSSNRVVTTGTVSDNYDMANFIRTSQINGGGSFAATGSVVYVENAVTNSSGTVTDTANGVEVVMDSLGTGDGVKITHAATGGKALNIIGAATSVSDVLITTSGVKANNKGALEVTNSGATAAGGSILRVTNTGEPAAATSYLVDLDYSGATMTNNPTTVYINGKDSTNSTVEINSSAASAASKGMLSLLNSNTGATGVVVHTQHTSTGSAAANDAVLTVKAEGLDSGDAVTEYGRLEAEIMTATAGQEDGRWVISAAANNGTLTQMATVNPRAGGALAELVMGSGAGAAYVTSSGAYDLVIDTNEGTNSGTITITDAANGDIAIVPNGTGQVQLTAPTYGQYTALADGAAVLTIAQVGLVTMGNTIARTITLPAAATSAGAWYTVKKTSADAAAITVDGNAAETIDGAETYTAIDAQYDVATFVCDGSGWHIVNKSIAA